LSINYKVFIATQRNKIDPISAQAFYQNLFKKISLFILGVPLRVGLFAAMLGSSPHPTFSLLSLTQTLKLQPIDIKQTKSTQHSLKTKPILKIFKTDSLKPMKSYIFTFPFKK
jgi:hypothetical protein